jgi:hypothetical protein
VVLPSFIPACLMMAALERLSPHSCDEPVHLIADSIGLLRPRKKLGLVNSGHRRATSPVTIVQDYKHFADRGHFA